MKKKFDVVLAGALAVLGFVGCGDENTTQVTEQTGLTTVAAGEKMDMCTEDKLGDMVFVADSAAVYYCDGKSWLTLNDKDGADGKDGKDGKDGNGGATSSASVSSSSMKGSSSSGIVVINGNTFTDSRDGRKYKYAAIGSSLWMVENLKLDVSDSYCYNDSKENCEKYGRFYTALTADRICPEGWELPTTSDWEDLATALGGGKTPSGKCVDFDGKSFQNEFVGYFTGSEYREFGETAYYMGPPSSEDYEYAYFTSDSTLVAHDLGGYSSSRAMPVRCLVKDFVDFVKDSCIVEGEVVGNFVCKSGEWVWNVEFSSITDSRDGQTYKTVTFGTQTWMAENLNYAYTGVPYDYSGDTSDSTSWCYDNDPANCTKYGRLYTWAAAMDSVGTWSTNGKGCGNDGKTCTPTTPVRGICPTGWHLPSKDEWNTLFQAVGGSSTAAKVLKSQTGWSDNGNGTVDFGFSALPAGIKYGGGSFSTGGRYAYFWSSTEHYTSNAYGMFLNYNNESASLGYTGESDGFSVRCLRD